MKRESFVDVIKGVCILFVVITHFSWSNEERLSYLFPFWIAMAVPFFMLCSGYVSAKSYSRRNISSLLEAYSPKLLLKKIVYYLVPCLVAFIIFTVISALMATFPGFSVVVYNLVFGKFGAGSYYTHLMIEFVLLFPLVNFLILKYKRIGLLILVAVNAAYELFSSMLNADPIIYRILIFRYLSLIAFGCYIGNGGSINKSASILLTVVGLLFTYLISYLDLDVFVFDDWKGTSYLATLFVVPVFYLLKNMDIKCRPIQYIGRISYSILFTQMIYYQYFYWVSKPFENTLLRVAVNVVICVAAGMIFDAVISPLAKYLSGLVAKSK